ncbi:MAG: P-loop NTPase [Candidatus Aminicenantes bacterium]|nr:P-loop NTPase [Candidatus Aminicenantes bacterium]
MNFDEKTGSKVEIWAVGGGKGGTGKTFLVSQAAITLAEQNKRVILLDTDFGGANIHSFFGIKRAPKTINLFFEKKEPLENLLMETGVENLKVIVGDYRSINSGSLNFAMKSRLFRHIRNLKADYVLLDLGGGTGNDTIDALLLADRMIVVAVPEITSVENLFQFIKSSFFRKLKQVLGDHGFRDTVREIWGDRKRYGIKNIVELIEYIKKNHADVDAILTRELADFAFYVILNKVRNSMEIKEGFSIRSICIKHIGVDTRYAGYIEYDFQFWKNLSLIRDLSKMNVSQSLKKDILIITDNIMSGEQMRMTNIKNG